MNALSLAFKKSPVVRFDVRKPVRRTDLGIRKLYGQEMQSFIRKAGGYYMCLPSVVEGVGA